MWKEENQVFPCNTWKELEAIAHKYALGVIIHATSERYRLRVKITV
ncbi:hypothetical protein LC613_37135 [Nostoc sphaeroides CHAB 2801]|uniref:Uncharacterized protein n=1 Tax=Nostoc sphaeroides CCNUC1 TaxID=2653204 RepID=A0A5P8WFG4_9NOSO|nr:hypothetical protein [Nostoc sphaeroides]MCC5632786.1 hypothetical protein [Nostoc sphaeroides CHAB 2801]MCC5632853.1 hypothetical protein [Nostoc sphaeroides CHAB 2801]MCC5633139.1 hypothetical protein [Nostoc sphaeroides CHAB 2801]QFS50569.1 hypothetical protein GXM_08063 [Nostoc sphaeroides CCNUC1]